MHANSKSQWLNVSENLSYIDGLGSNLQNLVEVALWDMHELAFAK